MTHDEILAEMKRLGVLKPIEPVPLSEARRRAQAVFPTITAALEWFCDRQYELLSKLPRRQVLWPFEWVAAHAGVEFEDLCEYVRQLVGWLPPGEEGLHGFLTSFGADGKEQRRYRTDGRVEAALRERVAPKLAAFDTPDNRVSFWQMMLAVGQVYKEVLALYEEQESTPVDAGSSEIAGTDRVDEAKGELNESKQDQLHIEEWKPPPNMIGAKAIFHKHGVPRSTLAGWVKKDNPIVDVDPKTSERYYPTEWVEGRLARWQKGKTTPSAKR